MQIAQKSVSKSIQNECAADTAGGVQRGLGMLPQQAIYEDWPSGEIKKMSKPVVEYRSPTKDVYNDLKIHKTKNCLLIN